MRTRTKAVCHAVFLVAVSWNIQLAAQPLDLGRSSVAQAKEPGDPYPHSHGRDPLAADSTWFREFKRDVSNEPADPHSDQMLARLRKAKGTDRCAVERLLDSGQLELVHLAVPGGAW